MRPTTLAAACLALVLSAALVTTARSAVPASDRLRQWNPSESWPGGEQYDPRLEKTVTFWNAGIPLAEVFQRIKEQTEVSIGLFPPDDMNRRVCVNLYLNPDQPPTLREVMAQLSWAVDCTLSYEDDGGEIRYSLLSTSMGEGDVVGAREAAMRAAEEAEREQQVLPQEEILRRREDLRAALSLSREEILSRYKDDDLVLLATLDPARRAMTEMYLSLPLDFGGRPRVDVLPDQRLSGLPPELRRLYLEATRPGLMRWLRKQEETGGALDTGGDPMAWFASLDPLVHLVLVPGASGGALVGGRAFVRDGASLLIPIPSLQVAGELDLGEEVALARLLGEIKSPEDENKVIEEWNRKQWAREPKEPMEAVKARERHEEIPAETERLLNSLQVVPNLKGMYALWQIQEAVAKVSGLNIVSDCFWQPHTRDLRLLYSAPGANRDAPPTALMVLKAATVRLYPWRPSEMSDMTDPFSTGWEWRGAGRFLSFRSLDRDIWRAAFLPAEVVKTMDAWVEPSLPATGARTAAKITPDWRAFGRLIADLSVPQLRWGGLLAYGGPTDYREACRQSLRERMLAQVNGEMGRLESLCLVSSLSEAQWQELYAEGLVVGRGLALSTVQEAFRGRPGWTFPGVIADNVQLFGRGTAGFAVGDVLRMRGGQTEKTEWEEPQPMVELEVLRGGRRIGHFVWRTSLSLHPRPVDSISLPSAKAGAGPSVPPADNSPH